MTNLKVSAENRDGEFNEFAANIINKMRMILEAVEWTPYGYDYMQTLGVRLYSQTELVKYLHDDGDYALTNELISAIYKAVETGNYYSKFSALATEELIDAIDYIHLDWRELDPETQARVKSHVNSALFIRDQS